MKILGIDPGMAIVGYSVIEYNGEKPLLLHSGSIQTSKDKSESARLLEIFAGTFTILLLIRMEGVPVSVVILGLDFIIAFSLVNTMIMSIM